MNIFNFGIEQGLRQDSEAATTNNLFQIMDADRTEFGVIFIMQVFDFKVWVSGL